MTKSINIAVADQHMLLRQGIVTMLKNEKHFNVLFHVNNGLELLENLKKSSNSPHIILWDIQTTVKGTHKTYIKIKKDYPGIKIILLSKSYNDSYITDLILDGAAGFLPKNCNFQQLSRVIQKVHKDGRYIDSSVTEALINRLNRNTSKDLTRTQLQLIRLLYEEKTQEEISKLMFLSKRTIEWHKKQCYVKTSTKSILGLMKYALATGIVG